MSRSLETLRVVGWVRRLADRLAEHPVAFHWLRKLPEWNYRATKQRIAAVRDELGKPSVLDCACGTGEYSSLFEPERYLGVDLNADSIAFARRYQPRHRYEVADLCSWPGTGELFDLVLVNGVLHHLDDAASRALLETAVRQLRPNGTLLVIEDVALPDAGFVTRLVQALDYGRFIRDAEAWKALVAPVLPIARSETYQSGWCPYHLMLCRNGAGSGSAPR